MHNWNITQGKCMVKHGTEIITITFFCLWIISLSAGSTNTQRFDFNIFARKCIFLVIRCFTDAILFRDVITFIQSTSFNTWDDSSDKWYRDIRFENIQWNYNNCVLGERKPKAGFCKWRNIRGQNILKVRYP